MVVAAGRGWPYFDPEYETLNATLNPPRVVIDNAAFPDATLIKLDSVNRHGILLDVVQVLTDLDLFISKAYVSSDGGWFMDVFHVTDQEGNKITDEGILKYIEEALGKKAELQSPPRRCCKTGSSSCSDEESHVTLGTGAQHTAIELTGPDRPGLLSEIFAALASLNCNVASAEVWTHNLRVACMIFVDNVNGGGPIDEPERLAAIKQLVCGILKGGDERKAGRTDFCAALTHTERRLHQMMSADGDYYDEEESLCSNETSTSQAVNGKGRPVVTVRNCVERGYSVVSIHCRDRSKLLFDTVCTLTDMDYMIFHATVLSEGYFAYQEFYIRHTDGCTLETEAERQRLIKCMVAAIERRFCEGLRLVLCTRDRVGLLSDVTRAFRQHGLSVAGAYVSTQAGMAVNTFYVTDASGNPVDRRTVDAIREEIGQAMLQVKDAPVCPQLLNLESISPPRFSFSTFFRAHSERLLYSLGLIRSAPALESSSTATATATAVL